MVRLAVFFVPQIQMILLAGGLLALLEIQFFLQAVIDQGTEAVQSCLKVLLIEPCPLAQVWRA